MNQTTIKDFNESRTFRQNLWLLTKFFLISLLTKVLAGLIVVLASKSGFEKVSEVLANKIKITDLYDTSIILILVIIISPIIEEFSFRGWLTKNPLLASVSLTFLVFHLVRITLFKSTGTTLLTMPSMQIALLVFSTIIAFLVFQKFSYGICNAINTYNTFFVVLSILSFSAIHATNYNIAKYDLTTILALSIILITYPIRAYLYTVIRLKSGLVWSIALHMLNNSIVVLSLFNFHNVD